MGKLGPMNAFGGGVEDSPHKLSWNAEIFVKMETKRGIEADLDVTERVTEVVVGFGVVGT